MKIIALAMTLLTLTALPLAADSTIEFKAGDADMNTAIDTARSTLDVFLKNVVTKKGESDYEASVKVTFDVTDGPVSVEHIWVGPFTTRDGQNFSGVIANEPQYLTDVKYGDEVTFKRGQIIDWSIWLLDGKSYGGYTTRVILQKLESAEAERLRGQMSDPIMPNNWR